MVAACIITPILSQMCCCQGVTAGSCKLTFKLAWNKFNRTTKSAVEHHQITRIQQSHEQKSAENCLLIYTSLAATAGLDCQIQISHVHDAIDGVKPIEKVDAKQSIITVKATWLNEHELKRAQATVGNGATTSQVRITRRIDSALSLYRLTLDTLTATTFNDEDIPVSQLHKFVQASGNSASATHTSHQQGIPAVTARPGPFQQQYSLPLIGRVTQGPTATPHVQVQTLGLCCQQPMVGCGCCLASASAGRALRYVDDYIELCMLFQHLEHS